MKGTINENPLIPAWSNQWDLVQKSQYIKTAQLRRITLKLPSDTKHNKQRETGVFAILPTVHSCVQYLFSCKSQNQNKNIRINWYSDMDT